MPRPTTALQAVNESNEDARELYESEKGQAMMKLTIILVQSVVIGLLLWATFVHFPVNNFLWTSNAQAVCKATRLDQVNVDQGTLGQFAMDAAVSLNSYDFLNYRRSITAAANSSMTPRGRDQYFKALDETGILDIIKKNYFVVTSFVTDPPQIRDKGVKGGVAFWNIEVPIEIWYAAGQTRTPEKRVLTFTVLAVDPTPQNQKGIAIDNTVSSQRVYK